MTDLEYINEILSGARPGVGLIVTLPVGDVPVPDDVQRYGSGWVLGEFDGTIREMTLETDGTDVFVVSDDLPGGRSRIDQRHPTQRWCVMFRRKSDAEV